MSLMNVEPTRNVLRSGISHHFVQKLSFPHADKQPLSNRNVCFYKVKLLFVSFGSRELEGGRARTPAGTPRPDPRADSDALKKAGYPSVFYVSQDTAHEFLSWRRSLREFAPLLFRD